MSDSMLVFAPLRLEAAALGASPDWRVLRSGMGPSRARIAAARGLAVDDAASLAVTGLCAAIDPALRPGDVVLTLGAGDITHLGRELAEWLPAA